MKTRPPDRYTILDAAPVASDDLFAEHMTAFVDRFVVGWRKDRWRHVLVGRTPKKKHVSAGLHADLDRRRCGRTDLPAVAALPGVGVFWDFRVPEPARLLTAADAASVGEGDDAVYSLVPGRLAVYFFHEYEVWLCRHSAGF